MIDAFESREISLRTAERFLARRDLPAALAAFDKAEVHGCDPNRCAAGRWSAHMLQGDFEAAWRESDAICLRGAPDPQRFWQGEDLRGRRVILRCLHGLGDAVQFLRFLPQLRACTRRLILEVPPRFVDLARCFDGADEVISWEQKELAAWSEWDVQVEVNELPYLFRIQAEDLPFATNYLHISASALASAVPDRFSASSLRVGLVWASGEWNPSRSVPFRMFGQLLERSGCEFWNLQGGTARKESSQWSAQHNLHDAEACADNLLHLAALIAQLDLVITPDTLAAHLAGALGTPAWVLLEHAADWRWMLARQDSLWYPSLRLFRQRIAGDWSGTIARMRDELKQLVCADSTQELVA